MPATRREFLEAGASAALAATLATGDAQAAARRPNVLVVIVDTLRADYVSAYGGSASTPNIDELARRGLRFTHSYPEAMATVPARRSILTGRRVWPFRHWHRRAGLLNTPGWAPISDPDDTFTSALRNAGYWTAYVTDNPFLGYSHEYARLRGSFNRFERTGGQLGNSAPLVKVSKRELHRWLVPELREPHIEERARRFLGAGGYWRDESISWAAKVFTEAAGLLDGARTRQPFAMVVDTYEPHEPWTPPRAYIDLYGDPAYSGPEPCMSRYQRVNEWLSDKRAGPVVGRMRDLYAAEVTMTDRWLGVLLARMRALGLDRNTVIVLVADHGYLLGEHGWTGKIASILHPELIQVPLIVVDPRHPRPRTSAFLAQTHDIGPTVLSLANVRGPKGMDGVDLSPLLRGRRPREERKFAYGGYANWHYARTQEWAYVANNHGIGRRLYDLERDPAEHRNIARRHPKRIDELHRAIIRRAGRRLPVYR